MSAYLIKFLTFHFFLDKAIKIFIEFSSPLALNMSFSGTIDCSAVPFFYGRLQC